MKNIKLLKLNLIAFMLVATFSGFKILNAKIGFQLEILLKHFNQMNTIHTLHFRFQFLFSLQLKVQLNLNTKKIPKNLTIIMESLNFILMKFQSFWIALLMPLIGKSIPIIQHS